MSTNNNDYHLSGFPSWSFYNRQYEEYYDEDDHLEFYMSPQAQYRLQHDKTLSDHDKMLIQHMALRKFHVPGHDYWEDYIFWFRNNHPILCFWTAHPLHPLGKRERVINLLASLAFGLAATSCVLLWYHHHTNYDFDKTLVSILGIDVTTGMLSLMFFGGPLHVYFDLSIYFIQACPPCRTGGVCTDHFPGHRCWLWLGAHVAFLITIAALALAINVMLQRASINADGNAEGITTDLEHYSFLLLYVLEVLVANFIMFPIGTLTMFSGILGCGRIPGLGGRPFQVRKHERMQRIKEYEERQERVSQV